MAVHVTTKQFSVLGHVFYFKLKTRAEKIFAFKFKKYRQVSWFWKPERWTLYVAISSVHFTIEHRWIIPGPGEK